MIKREGTPKIPSNTPEPKQLDHVLHTNPTRISLIDEIGVESLSLFPRETLGKIIQIQSNPPYMPNLGFFINVPTRALTTLDHPSHTGSHSCRHVGPSWQEGKEPLTCGPGLSVGESGGEWKEKGKRSGTRPRRRRQIELIFGSNSHRETMGWTATFSPQNTITFFLFFLNRHWHMGPTYQWDLEAN